MTNEKIIKAACKVTGITREELMSSSKRIVVTAKMLVVDALTKKRLTLRQIATILNLKQHCTIIHHKNQIQNLFDIMDDDWLYFYDEFNNELNKAKYRSHLQIKRAKRFMQNKKPLKTKQYYYSQY